MIKTSGTPKDASDKLVGGIIRKIRKHCSAEEKIRIVLAKLRGEESIAALCGREEIAESLYYSQSKEFLEGGVSRRRLEAAPNEKACVSGGTFRQATVPEVKELGSEFAVLKKVFIVDCMNIGRSILKKVAGARP